MVKDETFKLQLLKLSNGYLRVDKQATIKNTAFYLRVHTSVVKPGERYSEEPAGYLCYEGGSGLKVVGRPSG